MIDMNPITKYEAVITVKRKWFSIFQSALPGAIWIFFSVVASSLLSPKSLSAPI
jgi:hypothetical protein